MTQTVADVLLDRVRQRAVHRVLGYSGDGISGLLAAWGRAGDQLQLVRADLHLLRSTLDCDIAAGEYVTDVFDPRRLAPADSLQLDMTRRGGYTGWLRWAGLADAAGLKVSAHCAPSLHAPVAAAVPWLRHVLWFIDHARLEPLLVDGAPPVVDRGTATIHATGQLTALGADLLCGTVEDLRRHGWIRITLELQGVEAADDEARGLLIDLRRTVVADGGELVLSHLETPDD